MQNPLAKKLTLLLTLSLAVIGLDQWSKYRVLSELTTAFDSAQSRGARLRIFYSEAPAPAIGELHFAQKRFVNLSDRFFRLRYAENPGAAWGLFRELPPHIRGPLFHSVSIAAVIFIAYYFSKMSGTARDERWALYGLPLVLGGALGNYFDRLARGFVVDFLEAHWFDKAAWPSFNVADAAICVGVGMLLVDAMVRKDQPVEKREETRSEHGEKALR